eukprot:675576-Prorocentrum_minimum.AAC.2
MLSQGYKEQRKAEKKQADYDTLWNELALLYDGRETDAHADPYAYAPPAPPAPPRSDFPPLEEYHALPPAATGPPRPATHMTRLRFAPPLPGKPKIPILP